MSFTYQYSQPEDYHFSLDSIQAPKVIANRICNEANLADWQVLDLCAGCGVMGFELSWHLPELKNFHFLEVQDVYLEHFKKNIQIVNRPEVNFTFHLQNYAGLIRQEPMPRQEHKAAYDLVVCNPPYFRIDQGKLSPSEFKNRCRFFIDSDFNQLLETVLWVLKPKGQAYLLLRSLKDHGRSVEEDLSEVLQDRARSEIVADIRGTDLVRIAFS